MKKILIMGLPGVGKTTLAKHLAQMIGAVHLNADEIRSEIHKDLRFSLQDRIEHSRRMGKLCDIVARSGVYAIADFVCPTFATRKAFGDDFFMIFIDRKPCRDYPDTTRIFQPPTSFDLLVTEGSSPIVWAEIAAKLILSKQNNYDI
jgi:DNA polymerase III delta prime subunit